MFIVNREKGREGLGEGRGNIDQIQGLQNRPVAMTTSVPIRMKGRRYEGTKWQRHMKEAVLVPR